MPIELAGISNVYEFYSEHYLQTVFEGDVKELFQEWREAEKAGETPPDRRLAKVGTLWRRLSADFASERNDRARLLIFRQFAHEFLGALGYERDFELVEDAEDKLVPVLARRHDHAGHDRIWIVEVPSLPGEDFSVDPLSTKFRCEQFENVDAAVDVSKRRKDNAETAINKGVFALKHPPRFVVLFSMAQAVLIDREKWGDSRLLRFDFSEIFGRGNDTTLGAVAALLLATSLAPENGTALIDRIDEESHRHAYGVSKDLKYALREAIEILGNEAAELIVEKRRAQQKGVFTGENALDANVLSTECLRYMYRLLFLFYIEARPELGFAPISDAAYASGYSLNSLRELELVPLESDEDKNGHFLSDTIDTLFRIVFEGTPEAASYGMQSASTFSFHPVRARLFSPEAIGTYLGGLRFRNAAMQKIVELLSLSRPERGKGRGRISYAQLGISQLGAVYESLLSFSGFFADTDLIELKPKDGDAPGPLEAAYFAPLSRAPEFDGEIVYDGNSPRVRKKGSFIYRLAGRNRENSASYYTPEPLARVLVKYALKELLVGKKADDILELKVIEPAMGSAAFLVEVVNQLADKYLELKQAELGKRIPHEERGDVERRVRAYLADRNVFGVDLNPIAVELGQISLWLDCLHKGGRAPWFDDQLHNGNSLVGARRAVQPVSSLSEKREEDRWHHRKPREIGWSGEKRKGNEVWHFLLPDPGMSSYDQKIVRPLAPEAWSGFTEWRRGFMKPFDKVEIDSLVKMSATVDLLFDDVADRLRDMRKAVNDDIAIWPAEPKADEKVVDFNEKMKRLANFHGDGARNAVSWRRLRTAMDAWCALWFWPIDKTHLLPARETFIVDLQLVLEGKMGGRVQEPKAFASGSEQGRLFETVTVPGRKGSGSLFETQDRASALANDDLFGDVDVDKLIANSTWLPTAMEVAKKHRFMHFDLEFADVMREQGGFDLVIGNPPWMRPAWVDASVLSDKWPELAIRNYTAAEVENLKPSLLGDKLDYKDYLDSYASVGGFQCFVSSSAMFPVVGGGQPNLYKCFVDLAFRLSSPKGYSALVHQDSHLTDPHARNFRRHWYSRIRKHFNFHNVMKSKMFTEINHQTYYSLNIYGNEQSAIKFEHAARLFLPHMVDDCYQHDGIGIIPSPKDSNGNYVAVAHRNRIVTIDDAVLEAFSKVIEEDGCPSNQTRFLFPYSLETISVFRNIGNHAVNMATALGELQMSGLLHESGAAKRGTIRRSTQFPKIAEDVILNGSAIYVANPLYKSAESKSSSKGDFEEIDLNAIPEKYYPRCNYAREVTAGEYRAAIPDLPWQPPAKHTDVYRIAFRMMLSKPMERTLVAALIPPGFSHVNGVESVACRNLDRLVDSYPLFLSIVLDFIVKSSDHANFRQSNLKFLPYADLPEAAKHRALRLACLTSDFAPLWEQYSASFSRLNWSSDDARLLVEAAHGEVELTWNRDVAIRSAFARRLALVEIDVLVSMALGLGLEHLLEIYRTMFPVLDENERGTWYDSRGEIVWTCSKGLSGRGYFKNDGKKPSALEWNELYAGLEPGRTLKCEIDVDFLPSGSQKVTRTFVAPFSACDREADYRRAWAHFEAESKKKGA